jgi:hypothetical protein
MNNRWRQLVIIGAFCLTGVPPLLWAIPPFPVAKKAKDPPIDYFQDALKLAAKIDQLIDARLTAAGIQPAPQADDAEFLRRIHLDLAGRIPGYREVSNFLEETTPDKRQHLVENLLESPAYVKHFTNVWRSLLLPQSNNQQAQVQVPSFEAWLRRRIRDNARYDEMVREILTASISAMPNARRMMNNKQPELTPVAFYQANELKPENLAASTSRLFLGVKLECAQCHDHPHAEWTRKQFWEYAAFFSGVQALGAGGPMMRGTEIADSRSIKIPGTERVVLARFLDDTEPRWQPGTPTRAALAEWTTAPENPFFARAAVNRVWAHFFGIGLAEPVDDMSEENPPSHPELLDELAREFTAHRFDVKFLIRAITNSRTYQRSSRQTHASQNEPRLFARMAIRGMTPEQLYDSLVQATGFREAEVANPRRNPFGAMSPRAEFLSKFASQDKPAETQTSILQALSLMNGRFVADATHLENSVTLAAVIDAPFHKTPQQRIETLYLATLGRKPRPDEMDRLTKYVSGGGPKKDQKAALADVFWALLNSAEFRLNH